MDYTKYRHAFTDIGVATMYWCGMIWIWGWKKRDKQKRNVISLDHNKQVCTLCTHTCNSSGCMSIHLVCIQLHQLIIIGFRLVGPDYTFFPIHLMYDHHCRITSGDQHMLRQLFVCVIFHLRCKVCVRDIKNVNLGSFLDVFMNGTCTEWRSYVYSLSSVV